MENLVKDIQQRVEGIDTLKYVDEDNGQLDYYQENPPVKFPCALIDVDQADWQNEGRYIQSGLVTVYVRIATIRLSNSSRTAPASQKTNALSILSIMKEVYQKLHGWQAPSSENYTKLIRVRTKRVKRNDGIREYVVTFSTQYTDASATPDRQKIKPIGEVNAELDTTGTAAAD